MLYKEAHCSYYVHNKRLKRKRDSVQELKIYEQLNNKIEGFISSLVLVIQSGWWSADHSPSFPSKSKFEIRRLNPTSMHKWIKGSYSTKVSAREYIIYVIVVLA